MTSEARSEKTSQQEPVGSWDFCPAENQSHIKFGSPETAMLDRRVSTPDGWD